jgi:hypothetical protein
MVWAGMQGKGIGRKSKMQVKKEELKDRQVRQDGTFMSVSMHRRT